MTTLTLPGRTGQAARTVDPGHAGTRRPPSRRAVVAPPVPVRRRWWTDLVGVLVWASALFVVALWVSNGGVTDLLGGGGAALVSLGRITGLVSSDMLLLQVIAMARIPFVERALGQDKIVRWHRLLGFTSVNLLLTHAVLTTIGYGLLDRISFLPELWSLVTTAPGMLLATAGTALFGLITVTSIRAARRRIRYESWHLLHLYAYLGAGLALPHQLWTGTDFLFSPIATTFWWGLYAFALVSVLVYRVGVPLRRTFSQRLRVADVVTEAPGVVSVVMSGSRLGRLPIAAGQFFVWRFKTGAGWTRGHPLSLSAAPTTEQLRVTLSVRGDDGERIARMAPGTPVLIEGPYGLLTQHVRTRAGIVAFAGGLGIAPLLSLLQEAHRDGRLGGVPATLVRRCRDEGPQPLQADIDALVRAGALRVFDLVGPRSKGGTPWLPVQLGHVPGPEAVRQLVPDFSNYDVFVCGTSPWAEAVAADASAAGVPEDALHVERFAW